MLKRKVVTSLMLVLLCVSGTLFAHGQSESEKAQTVDIWSFNLSTNALSVVQNKIIKEYELKNPGVTVNWQNIPYDGYREKLLTAAAGQVLPDVFIDGYNMLGTYYSAGIIEDFTDMTKSWNRWEEIDSSLTNLTYYDKKCYGLPFRTKVYPVLINTQIFKECGLDPDNPPSTWDEALAAASKIVKVENGVVTRMGVSGFRTTSAFMRAFDLFVQQDGGSFLNEDGTPAFNNQHGLNALEYLNKLYRTQLPVGAAPLDESATDAFVAGKAGMAIMGSYDAVQTALQTGNTEMQKFTKVIPPFRGNNADGKPVSFFDGDMMYMSALSKHKQAAWDFIKYFYEPDVFMTYVEANKVVPIYRSQMNNEYMQKHPLLQGIMEMQKYGGTLAATPAYRSARSYLADEIEKTLESGQSAQKSLDNTEKAWLREIRDLK